MVGFDAQNKNILDNKFICPACSLILRDPVQLLTCGHRLCQSCFHQQNQTPTNCPQCQTETSSNQIMIDRGFSRDMQSLAIICSYCNWTSILKNYQEHFHQCHPHYNHCQEQFTSTDQLNQHHLYQCQKKTVECLLKDFGCHQQILRCELATHYRSQQHQESMLNVIHQMKNNTSRASTTTDESSMMNRLNELCDGIDTLGNAGTILNKDAERVKNGLDEHENMLQNLTAKALRVKWFAEDNTTRAEQGSSYLDKLNQNLISLKEKTEEMQYVSYDGTFVWKITNFQDKMNDAQSERQTSIYSPPFYSSSNGYKMQVYLDLHGDGVARHTHMSIFFVLMRGRNDAILKFPFNYKVTFCLYDQTPQLRHIIDSFRPDIKSNSFQRPRSEMNIASGIPKFFPLNIIQQEGNPYVRDDTMFIKIMVDFGDISKKLLPFVFSLNPGLPTNVQQTMLEQERGKRKLNKRCE